MSPSAIKVVTAAPFCLKIGIRNRFSTIFNIALKTVAINVIFSFLRGKKTVVVITDAIMENKIATPSIARAVAPSAYAWLDSIIMIRSLIMQTPMTQGRVISIKRLKIPR